MATTRLGLLSVACLIALIALGLGLWMEAGRRPGAAPATPEEASPNRRSGAGQTAARLEEAPKSELSAMRTSQQKSRAELALKQSAAAREMRGLALPQDRIAYFTMHAPVAAGDDARQLFNAAGDDPSRDVRMEAVNLLDNTVDRLFQEEFLLEMIQDEDELVRETAFDRLGGREVAVRVKVLSQVLNSSNPQTAAKAASKLAMYRTKAAVESLLQHAVLNQNTANGEFMLGAVASSLGQTFDSPVAASEWWVRNQANYAEDLSLAPPR